MVTEILVKSIYQEEPFRLKEALLVLKDIEGIGIVYLDDKDIVRHRLVKKVDAYKYTENQQ
jgi:phosphate starvation-inducible PhoH-like protein